MISYLARASTWVRVRPVRGNGTKRVLVDRSPIEFHLLHGAAGIALIRERWLALAHELESVTLLQFPEYHESFAEAVDSESLQYIAALRDERLVGLIPVRESLEQFGPLAINILEFPEMPCPRMDVLVSADEDVTEFISLLSDKLAEATGISSAMMRFRGVPQDSALLRIRDSSSAPPRLHSQIGYNNVQVLGTAQSLQDILPGKLIRNLRARKRKLAKLGEIEFVTADTLATRGGAFDEFLNVEASGWKSLRGGRRAVKRHPEQVAFYRDLMNRYSSHDRCRIHLLKLNGQTIAGNFCISVGETCYSLKSGYDETYSHVAPGQLLRERVLEYYLSVPHIRQFDLISDYEWQRHWRPEQRPIFDVLFFRRSAKGLLLYAVIALRSRIKRNS